MTANKNIWSRENCQQEALKYKTRKEFKLKSGSAYNSAQRNRWLTEVCFHMPENNKKHKGYWSKELCQKEALKYKSRSEFKIGSGGAYDAVQTNNWLDDVCHFMPRKCKKSGFWTKENCLLEARKYETKKEFKANSGGAYTKARRSGWLNDVTGHMKNIHKELKKCIYEVHFEQSNTYYIGLTNNLERRSREHINMSSFFESSSSYTALCMNIA